MLRARLGNPPASRVQPLPVAQQNPPPGRRNASIERLLTSKSFVLKHSFPNVSTLQRKVSSAEEYHFGRKWHLQLSPEARHLDLYIHSADVSPAKHSLEYKCCVKFIGKHNDGSENVLVKSGHGDSDGEPFQSFVFAKWFKSGDLTEYLVNDGLSVEIEICITGTEEIPKRELKSFDETTRDVSDVVLVIQENKFYTSKLTLAAQSKYFKNLFFGPSANSRQKEYSLENIDPFDVQKLLEVLHHLPAVDGFTVESLLLTATNTETDIVKEKCQEYLLSGAMPMNNIEMFNMFIKYELNIEKFLAKLTHAELKDIIPSNIDSLPPSIIALLLERSLSFAPLF